ncbi:putative membrane protein YqjE [Chromohalobacter marismortui]|uniref:Putative membrane protein YqjE n=1 Tax=Chromohalobacter marismortui TaxID=42055 RepID=A0A4R7NUS3_9GAMM|nr:MULTISPECIES: phage holin family protein [Chromohalobacter]MCI0510539.1 phage holin family protein [Chromohalobacter sp.]MCI0594108.1 phage holin family protein [Chromohalobacter sp.]TDU24885.1 putative membrane protein YqjE [Chromohalobacter marismortui]
MADRQGPAERVITSARRLLSNMIAMGETRLRLAVLELETERDRMLSLLLLAGAALITFSFAIGMLLLMLVVLYWEDHRLLAIGLCSAVLFIIAACLAYGAKRIAKRRRLMQSTLSHLAQDRQALGSSRESS